MKKPLAIESGVWQRLRVLTKSERAECLLALCDLEESFGRPHIHSGLGIRKLTARSFECRGNLALRFISRDEPDGLKLIFLGNHDEVRRLIRSGHLE